MKFLQQETIIDILRHGEPVGGRKIRGQCDDPLSELGWQQMWDAIGDDRMWSHIESSPLSRCAAFAEKLANEHTISLSYDADLKEIGFGDWEGLTTEQIEDQYPGAIQRYWQDPIQTRPENAEPVDAFQRRVHTSWQRIVKQYQAQHILVVAHAGVLRIIAGWTLNMQLQDIFRIQLPFAARIRLHIGIDEAGTQYPRLVLPDKGNWL